MKVLQQPRPLSAEASPRTEAPVTTSTRVRESEQRPITEPRLPSAHAADDANLGGGLPPLLLEHRLGTASAALKTLDGEPLPQTPVALVEAYQRLGAAAASCEACLMVALDALDPRSGGGRADPAAPFEKLRETAFAGLRHAGTLFARFEPSFAEIAHGEGSWPSQPIQVEADRGDGRPLYHYRNTFKEAGELSGKQKLEEYRQRVEKFESKGGRFEDLILATPGFIERLDPSRHYDYTMLADGTTQLAALKKEGEELPKPGHSLLAVGGPDFVDRAVLCAGELWVLQDSAGDVEAVIVANNSGHFKPEFADLENVLPFLEQLGIPRDKIVLFGGPNNLRSMFKEIAEKHPQLDLGDALPAAAAAVREELGKSYDAISLRARS